MMATTMKRMVIHWLMIKIDNENNDIGVGDVDNHIDDDFETTLHEKSHFQRDEN